MSVTLGFELYQRCELHIQRLIWHLGWGAFLTYAFVNQVVSTNTLAILCLVFSVLGFLNDFKRFKDNSYNEKFIKFFRGLLRKREVESFSGFPFFALGVGLTILFFPFPIAAISLLFLTFSDPVASIVGIKWGEKKFIPHKSLAGVIAFFVSSYICVMTYALLYLESVSKASDLLIFAVLASVIGLISELISSFNIDDNLTIPVISGGGMTLLNLWLSVF